MFRIKTSRRGLIEHAALAGRVDVQLPDVTAPAAGFAFSCLVVAEAASAVLSTRKLRHTSLAAAAMAMFDQAPFGRS